MLSDEERKAMDSLKVISEYAGDNYLAKEHRRKLKLLIELVEKQSKEIEELKEDNKEEIEELPDCNYSIKENRDKINEIIRYIKRKDKNK